jgi:hypothetical protein
MPRFNGKVSPSQIGLDAKVRVHGMGEGQIQWAPRLRGWNTQAVESSTRQHSRGRGGVQRANYRHWQHSRSHRLHGQGKYCTRIHKAIDNSSIEVYLDESNRSLNVSPEGRAAREICRYRITEDRKGAEFFVHEPHESAARAISVDEACQRAIAEFIFTPFPALQK